MTTITIDTKLATAIVELHNIARLIEQELGQCVLSEVIRKCADRLHGRVSKEYQLIDPK